MFKKKKKSMLLFAVARTDVLTLPAPAWKYPVDRGFPCGEPPCSRRAVDSGVLSYKDHLPLSRLLVGDTNRSGSEAVYRVGPLRCYGDSEYHTSAR